MQRFTVAFLVALLLVASSREAAATDPAARGLDLFLHAPSESASGGTLPVQIRVFGFSTVSTLAPRAGARVEAAWDPESLGENVAVVPPPVVAACDDQGRAHLDVPVPPGSGKLTLLVSARWQGHQRTRSLSVERSRRYSVDLHTSDQDVVPGGTLSAWVFVRDSVTAEPAAGKAVDLSLKEGSVRCFRRRLVTDAAGMASTQLGVPQTSDPTTHWLLSAATAIGDGEEAEANLTLGVREESPQAPSLALRWTHATAAPGSLATAIVDARDGTGQGLPQWSFRYWVGPRGTHAPRIDGDPGRFPMPPRDASLPAKLAGSARAGEKDDKAWRAASKEGKTDSDGKWTLAIPTPATIPPRGSSLTLVVRGTSEGRPLSAEATLALVAPAAEVTLEPELGALLPGQTQRLFVRTSLDGKPLQTTLALEGHGLAAKAETNARGWAAVPWTVPSQVGARQPEQASTDCAGQVAATVRVRWLSLPAGISAKPIDRCVRVDRDAVAAIRPEQPTVRAGEPLAVRILGAKGSASLIARANETDAWQSAWLHDASRGGSIRFPASAKGAWTLGAAGLMPAQGKSVLGTSIRVLPTVLPKLTAAIEAPRASPGATVAVTARLDDGHGHALTGSVGAVVFDKTGGTHPEHLLALDTRHALTTGLDLADDAIDAFLDGDPRFDIERWAIRGAVVTPPEPAVDPPASVNDDVEKAFSAIVQSLEGAVYQASSDGERLEDVRVRRGKGFALNPEMLTLVTEAMAEPALTPGGEAWQLPDLMAVDPQVSYDNVARRVTRLKLFRLLAKLRDHLFENKLGPDEPALRDPNALLRRLGRDEAIEAGELMDPWGHGMTFVRSTAPRIPFLSLVPGYRLVSAGPDGRFGTADDVSDPFQRVLASNTPYAKAVQEDRIVDAKWDMRVGDETVEAWKKALEETTGEELGGDGVGGLGTIGTGGGGSGYGSGVGGLGGRRSRAIDLGAGRWLPPVRTDREGRARLLVPLGDAETTWQIVLVAVPDHAGTAASSVEVTTALPVSVHVDSGAAWMVGDDLNVPIRLRNRTDKTLALTLEVSVSGAARLVDTSAAKRTLSLAPSSSLDMYARVHGTAVGTAVMDARIAGTGQADRVRHTWQVQAAGETTVAEHAAFVEGKTGIPLPSAATDRPAAGQSRMILERGLEPVLTAAVDSLAPSQLTGLGAYADALEVLGRVRAWALVRGGERHALAIRTRELGQQIEAVLTGRADEDGPLLRRARHWAVLAADIDRTAPRTGGKQGCPTDRHPGIASALSWLEVAPRTSQGVESKCWASLRAEALNPLASEEDPVVLARAVLVFAEQPEQAAVVAALAKRLSALVPAHPDGTVVLPAHEAGSRPARSVALCALATYGQWEKQNLRPLLWARLLTERDGHGGYGSAEATRRVVRALLARDIAGVAGPAPAPIRYSELSDKGKVLSQGKLALGENQTVTVPLGPATASVRIETASPVLIRTQRPLFRSFYRPVDPAASPLHVDVTLPKAASARTLADLQVTLAHDLGRRVPVVVRIPLPAGAMLAEKSDGLSQLQGAVYLRTSLDSDSLPRVLSVPLRFGIAGTVTMPEVTARITDDDVPVAHAPARPLTIAGP